MPGGPKWRPQAEVDKFNEEFFADKVRLEKANAERAEKERDK